MDILEANDTELNKTNDSCTPGLLIESTRQCICDNAFTPEVNRWYAQACLAWQLCWIHYCIKSNPITASSLPPCPERCVMQAPKYAIPQCSRVEGKEILEYAKWKMAGTDVDFKMHGRDTNLNINLFQLRYLEQALLQLLCHSLSVLFALGFAVVCWGIAPVWPRVLMLFLCAAAGAFCHFRGSANTLWYPLQHLDALCYADGGGFLGTALLGLGLSGNLWNGTM